MAAHVANCVIDDGLASLKDAARYVYITSAEPTTYLEASSTFALGSKDLGAGGVFPAAIAAGTNGRKLTTAAFDDGSVTGTGTVFNWAITDASNLLVVDALSAGLAITAGNTFSLAPFDVSTLQSMSLYQRRRLGGARARERQADGRLAHLMQRGHVSPKASVACAQGASHSDALTPSVPTYSFTSPTSPNRG